MTFKRELDISTWTCSTSWIFQTREIPFLNRNKDTFSTCSFLGVQILELHPEARSWVDMNGPVKFDMICKFI